MKYKLDARAHAHKNSTKTGLIIYRCIFTDPYTFTYVCVLQKGQYILLYYVSILIKVLVYIIYL